MPVVTQAFLHLASPGRDRLERLLCAVLDLKIGLGYEASARERVKIKQDSDRARNTGADGNV